MDALINATLWTGERESRRTAVLVEHGIVQSLVADDALPAHVRIRDLGGGLLAPGLIDLQVNGGGGLLFNDAPTVATLARIAAAHRRRGTTSLLPTLISDSRPARAAAREAVVAAITAGEAGILGLHLEGPHLNPSRAGVHDPRWLTAPDAADCALMAPLPVGRTLVTLAPEMVSDRLITELAGQGVRLLAGHSEAGYDRVLTALAAGVSGFTHLFNAMPAPAGRLPGIVGAALDDRDSWCCLIGDGHHLHDAILRLAWRAKPPGRVLLVSDAMPPVGGFEKGSPVGGFESGSPVGGGGAPSFRLGERTIIAADGRCVTADGRLAGSAADLASAVRHCVRQAGIPLEDALCMASTWPAEFLGLGDRLGRIAPGYPADFVQLDEALRVRETFVGGRPVSESDPLFRTPATAPHPAWPGDQ
jgi:N-acetylglucosamine-6-phosphate deacetylase